MAKMTIKREFHFERGRRSRKVMKQGTVPDIPEGTIPRVSRLIALAYRFDKQIRKGLIIDRAEIARLGHVSRARISQVMKLLDLAPDIQEDLLFLPPVVKGRDPITERHVRPITQEHIWKKQRQMWQKLKSERI